MIRLPHRLVRTDLKADPRVSRHRLPTQYCTLLPFPLGEQPNIGHALLERNRSLVFVGLARHVRLVVGLGLNPVQIILESLDGLAHDFVAILGQLFIPRSIPILIPLVEGLIAVKLRIIIPPISRPDAGALRVLVLVFMWREHERDVHGVASAFVRKTDCSQCGGDSGSALDAGDDGADDGASGGLA